MEYSLLCLALQKLLTLEQAYVSKGNWYGFPFFSSKNEVDALTDNLYVVEDAKLVKQ